MALIGGTLAISKDLISGDNTLPEDHAENFKNKEPQTGKQKGSGEKQE